MIYLIISSLLYLISSVYLIYLMGALYKIFTKVLANRLQKYLSKLTHSVQYGFIVGENILHNVLNVEMAIDYVRNTH